MISALEKINADAVILVYNKHVDDIKNVVLGNPNGWGRHIMTPGIVISKEDGHKLKNYLDSHNNDKSIIKKIYFELDFTVQESDIVEYEIYFSNGYDQVYDLMRELSPMHQALGDRVNWEPKYVSHRNFHYTTGLVNDCLSAGNYCMYNIDYFFNFNGRDLILHNVKEKCIWQTVKDKPLVFFQYIDKYVKCSSLNYKLYNKEDCIDEILTSLGISLDVINRCYANNFKSSISVNGANLNDKNTIIQCLEDDRNDYISQQIVFLPSILINKKPYYVMSI
jgi:hypothetical protein